MSHNELGMVTWRRSKHGSASLPTEVTSADRAQSYILVYISHFEPSCSASAELEDGPMALSSSEQGAKTMPLSA